MQLVPVEHDPFADDPTICQLNSIQTELASTAKKISEIMSQITAFGAAAHRIDAVLKSELDRLAEVIDAGARHFDDKLTELRADLSKAAKRSDMGPHTAKLEAAIAQITKMSADLAQTTGVAAPVPVTIERDKTGKPVKIRKGDQMFSIERQDGNVTRLVPEGHAPEDETPKKPRASKRFAN
jgi:uncharacterized phage infection (PIP) family protein YhgE